MEELSMECGIRMWGLGIGTIIYDPIEDIVNLCEKFNIWTHVDGMFGGLLVMSDEHAKRFKGIER